MTPPPDSAWSVHGLDGVLFGDVDRRRSSGGPTLVATLGFKAAVEAFEMQRYVLIAQRLGARVIVVETPGFGYAGGRLRPVERRALAWHGDFTPLAERLSATLVDRFSTDLPDRLGLIGYSMGCSLGSALIRATNHRGDRHSFDTAVLVEPVAVRRWGVGGLVAAVRSEDRRANEYLGRNDAGSYHPPVDRRLDHVQPAFRRLDMLLTASALRRPRIADDLVGGIPGLRRVAIVHGDQSRLSPPGAQRKLLDMLRTRGVAAADVTVPGPHAVWLSMPDVVTMTDLVRDTLCGLPVK